jgi:hypothetical protein
VALTSLAQQQSARPSAPAPKPEAEAAPQIYRNLSLGFRYQIPYGWVDRTKSMQQGTEPGKGEVLLAVFEHPPEVSASGINSAVVIAAEDVASYPGLKTAVDYLGPLNEVTAARGFKPAGDPSEIAIDGRNLIRADFTKPLVTPPATASDGKLTMHQSTLVLVVKGQIVSFTFLAGTSEEVDQLIENLGFGPSRPASRTSPKH